MEILEIDAVTAILDEFSLQHWHQSIKKADLMQI